MEDPLLMNILSGVVLILIDPLLKKMISKLGKLRLRPKHIKMLNYVQYGSMLLLVFLSLALYSTAKSLCLLYDLPLHTSVIVSSLIPIYIFLLIGSAMKEDLEHWINSKTNLNLQKAK